MLARMNAARWSAAVAIGLLALSCSASDGAGGGSGASGSGASGGGGGTSGSGGSGTGATGAGGSGAVAGGQIGDACQTNDDCTNPPDAECWTTIGGGPVPEITFPGGFCSKACDANGPDGQCGDEAGCSTTSVSGGQGSVQLSMCSPPCSSDAECRQAEGYKCFQIIPGFGVCTL